MAWPEYLVIKVSELHPHPRKRRKLISDIVESPDYAGALVDAIVIEKTPARAIPVHHAEEGSS